MSRLLGVLPVLMAAAAPAAAQLAYEGSLGMTTGKYIFTTPTTSFSLINGLALTTGRLTFRGSIPLWLQNSTVVTMSGSGTTVPSGGSAAGTVSDSGKHQGGGGMNPSVLAATRRVEMPSGAFTDYQAAVGDPLLGITVALLRGGRVMLDVGGLAKVPVADTAHFGTGQWDFGANASASIHLGGTTLLGADAAWWYLGDLPALDFNNPVSGSLTLTHIRANRWAFSVFARGASTAVPGFAGPASAGGGITWLSGRVAFGVEGFAGLTETSPDVGITASWRVQGP